MTMVHTLSVCLVTAFMITSVSSMGRFTTVSVDVDNDGFDDCAFETSVAVGTKVVFEPSYDKNVGIFDTKTNKFSTVDTNMTMGYKFSGATAVGTKVVFAPNNADVVGVFDTETDTFSTHYTALTMTSKFAGATAVGTKVVFTPYDAKVVGVFDTETDTYSDVDTSMTMEVSLEGPQPLEPKLCLLLIMPT